MQAQDVDLRIYSEFQRIPQSGEILAADRAAPPREILSPAVLRNAFSSFQFAVTGRPQSTYFISLQTNPENVFQYKVYRQHSADHAGLRIPDELALEPKPDFFFAVLPPAKTPKVTETYWLDIWTPPEAPADTVRFEVLVKRAYWTVAPLEIRVMHARAPAVRAGACCGALPGPPLPLDRTAWQALARGLAGDLPLVPRAPVTIRSMIWRNAVQDAALLRSLDAATRTSLTERLRAAMKARLEGAPSARIRGAESYLEARKLIFQAASRMRETPAQHVHAPPDSPPGRARKP